MSNRSSRTASRTWNGFPTAAIRLALRFLILASGILSAPLLPADTGTSEKPAPVKTLPSAEDPLDTLPPDGNPAPPMKTLPSYLDQGLDDASVAGTTIDPSALQTNPSTGSMPLVEMDSPNFDVRGKETGGAPGASKKSKKPETILAPIPSYRPQLGFGLALAAARLYHPFPDEDAPPWVTGVGGFYSQNGSWAVGALHKMNLDDDQWRMTFLGAYGNVNYNFYGVGEAAGNLGLSIPIQQRFAGGLAQVLYQVLPDFYVGGRYLGAKTWVGIDGSSASLPALIPPGFRPPGFTSPNFEVEETLGAIGPRLQYDTRDNEFYPTEGVLADVYADLYRRELGSDFDYENYKLTLNKYVTVSGPHILAFRAFGQMVSGDAPFFALSSFGGETDLRGYASGRYRDRMMVAGQVEYRVRITRRLGAVAFVGVGSVGGGWGDFQDPLPSVGLGLRYCIAKENGVDMRFDAAWGKDDSAVYFGVGQAF